MSVSAPDRRLSGHMPALDGVRGLAILSVMVFHYALTNPHGRIEVALALLTSFGWAGVDLFFVLSGFLITGILLDTRERPDYYRRFYLRRTLRIFPLYYAYCAVLFVALPLRYGLGSQSANALTAAAPWYLSYTMNIRVALGDAWVPATVASTAFFWSLCVEEQFYLLWPTAVARLDRDALARVCLWLVTAALLFRTAAVTRGHVFSAYVLLPGRMDALALGAWAAIVAREPGGLDRLARFAPVALLAAVGGLSAIALGTGYGGWDQPWMATIGYTCTGVASAALIVLAVAAREESWIHRVATGRLIRYTGRRAYGLYVLAGAAALTTAALGLDRNRTANVLVTTVIVFLLAEVSWRLLESRALALKDRVSFPSAAGESVREVESQGGR